MCLFRKKKKNKPEVGKIMETTDGFFQGKSSNKKERSVVVTQQRKMDGAIGVNKIHSIEGKDPKSKDYVQRLILDPKDHPSLTKKSIVERRTIWGLKNKKPIYKGDLTKTDDKLTRREQRKVNWGLGGPKLKHKITYRKTLSKWNKGFPKNKKK